MVRVVNDVAIVAIQVRDRAATKEQYCQSTVILHSRVWKFSIILEWSTRMSLRLPGGATHLPEATSLGAGIAGRLLIKRHRRARGTRPRAARVGAAGHAISLIGGARVATHHT